MIDSVFIFFFFLFFSTMSLGSSTTLEQKILFTIPEAESHFVKAHYALNIESSSICSSSRFQGSLDLDTTYQGGLILEQGLDGSVDYRFWSMTSSDHKLEDVFLYYETVSNEAQIRSYRSIKADDFAVVNFNVKAFTSDICQGGIYASLIFHYVGSDGISYYYIFGLGDNKKHLPTIESQLSDYNVNNVYIVPVDYACLSVSQQISAGGCSKSLDLHTTLTQSVSTDVISYTTSNYEKSTVTTLLAAAGTTIAVPSGFVLSSKKSSSVSYFSAHKTSNRQTASISDKNGSFFTSLAAASADIMVEVPYHSVTSSVSISPSFTELPHLHFQIPPIKSTTVDDSDSVNNDNTPSREIIQAQSVTNSSKQQFVPQLQGNIYENRTLASFGLSVPSYVGPWTRLGLNFTFDSPVVNSTCINTIFDAESVVNFPIYGDGWFALNITRQCNKSLDISFDVVPFVLSEFKGDFGVTAVVVVDKSSLKNDLLTKRSVSSTTYEVVATVNEPKSNIQILYSNTVKTIRRDSANTSNSSIVQIFEGSASSMISTGLARWISLFIIFALVLV